MSAPPYDALVVDLDGTIVGANDDVHPRVRAALNALRETGVLVVVATGRSEQGARGLLAKLEWHDPAVLYNGAAIWDPKTDTFLEERVLSNRTAARLMEVVAAGGWLPVVQSSVGKFAPPPRTDAERLAFENFARPTHYSVGELPLENVMRVSLFSDEHDDSASFAREVEEAVCQPVYVTHFPLNVLAAHRTSPLHVLDVQPPCRGKAEALRFLQETRGIPPERIVAVGDASNDVPMLLAAGLGVAMGGGMSDALEVADRVIGTVEDGAVADLVEELFGVAVGS